MMLTSHRWLWLLALPVLALGSGCPGSVILVDPDIPGGGNVDDDGDFVSNCGGLDYIGRCEGNFLEWCDGLTPRRFDCASNSRACGFVNDEVGYDCVDGTPMPDPIMDSGGFPDTGMMDSGTMDSGGPPTPVDSGTPPTPVDSGTPPPPPTPVDSGTPDPPPPPSPVGDLCGNDTEQAQHMIVNQMRMEMGLPTFRCSPRLVQAARKHSQDMCDQNYFNHSSLDGRSFGDRIGAEGVQMGAGAENIAWGQTSPMAVHTSWMNSPGHRRNLVGDYDYLGVGWVSCNGRPYWTQNFADIRNPTAEESAQ